MSLFVVERYLGEDLDDDGKKKQASDILKKLQKEAKARRNSLKIKNDTKEINVSELDLSQDNESETNHEQKKQRKKKKDKDKEKNEELEINLENQIDDDGKINIVKKKKKKRRHSDREITNCSNDETESDGPVKKGKFLEELEVESVECEDIKNKKPKKHKKQKRKHGKDLDEVVAGMERDVNMDSEENKAECDNMEADEKEVSEEEVDENNDLNKDGEKPIVGTGKETEIGGFTVIGNVRRARPEKVKRVLPEWLSNPSIISSDLDSDKIPISDMPGLAKDLVEKLKENKISHFFPVQRHVIPALLESSITGFHIGRAGYRPSDVCVSAPTGSGKTLAFVLPIVQGLRSRVTCVVRALAVLPVRDLATQVFKVFQTYCQGTDIKVGLMTGQKSLLAEQQSLIKKRLHGYHSMVDIIVATPGRLVDHLNQTEGFNLGHLRYLVIDEADRMMDEIKQDWLIQVENAVYKSRPRPGPLTASYCQRMEMPLQKLLYSATLSQNPEKLQQLSLFQPKLFTSVVKTGMKPAVSKTVNYQQDDENKAVKKVSPETDNDDEALERNKEIKTVDNEFNEETNDLESSKNSEKPGDFVGKYATPSSLSEYYIETTSGEKPLVLLHLLHHLKYRNILCFTNSVESTHRLFMLIKLYGGIEVKEFSSGIHVARRNAILQKFEAGKIDILVCSDAMARGMDITTVKYVVSYDPPSYIQTYIHRIGRTARAGKEGSAITLLQKKEFFHFKKMIKEAGKNHLQPLKISKEDIKPLLPKYEETLKQLSDAIKNEKPKRKYTPKKLQKTEIKNNTG